jgi:thymidylate synthase
MIEEFIEDIKSDDEFAKQWGELGPIYGKQWRKWGSGVLEDKHLEPIDQIQNLINDLKTNPDSRRLMVNAWNVGELDQMTLPPCHYSFQVYTTELTLEERQAEFCYRLGKDISFAKKLEHVDLDKDYVPKRKISLMWNQRSVDVFLGLPFNIASYALLLKLIGKEVNMVPDQLVGNLGDTHLYLNHLDQAKEQLKREPYCLPELKVSKVDILNGDFNYELHSYESHPSIKAKLSN